jgi:hypothetical protein
VFTAIPNVVEPIYASITNGVLNVDLPAMQAVSWRVSFENVTWNGFAAEIENIGFPSPTTNITISLRNLAADRGNLYAECTLPLQPPTPPSPVSIGYLAHAKLAVAGTHPMAQNAQVTVPGCPLTFTPTASSVLFSWSVWISMGSPATLVAYTVKPDNTYLFDWSFDTPQQRDFRANVTHLVTGLTPGVEVQLLPQVLSSAADTSLVVTAQGQGYGAWSTVQAVY